MMEVFSQWHIRFPTRASRAVLVRTNVPYPALQKKTVSMKSTQTSASIAAHALLLALQALSRAKTHTETLALRAEPSPHPLARGRHTRSLHT